MFALLFTQFFWKFKITLGKSQIKIEVDNLVWKPPSLLGWRPVLERQAQIMDQKIVEYKTALG